MSQLVNYMRNAAGRMRTGVRQGTLRYLERTLSEQERSEIAKPLLQKQNVEVKSRLEKLKSLSSLKTEKEKLALLDETLGVKGSVLNAFDNKGIASGISLSSTASSASKTSTRKVSPSKPSPLGSTRSPSSKVVPASSLSPEMANILSQTRKEMEELRFSARCIALAAVEMMETEATKPKVRINGSAVVSDSSSTVAPSSSLTADKEKERLLSVLREEIEKREKMLEAEKREKRQIEQKWQNKLQKLEEELRNVTRNKNELEQTAKADIQKAKEEAQAQEQSWKERVEVQHKEWESASKLEMEQKLKEDLENEQAKWKERLAQAQREKEEILQAAKKEADESLRAQREALEKEYQENVAKMETELRVNLQKEEQSLKAQSSKIKESAENKVKLAKKELEEVEKRYVGEISALKDQLKDAKEAVEVAEQARTRAEEEHARSNAEEVEKSERDLAELRQTVEKLELSLVEAEAHLQKVRESLEDKEKEVDRLSEKLQRTEQEKKSLRAAAQRAQSRVQLEEEYAVKLERAETLAKQRMKETEEKASKRVELAEMAMEVTAKKLETAHNELEKTRTALEQERARAQAVLEEKMNKFEEEAKAKFNKEWLKLRRTTGVEVRVAARAVEKIDKELQVYRRVYEDLLGAVTEEEREAAQQRLANALESESELAQSESAKETATKDIATPIEGVDVQEVHPVYGQLLKDFGYKRVYAARPSDLLKAEQLPVWESQRVFRYERSKAIAKAKANSLELGMPGIITIFDRTLASETEQSTESAETEESQEDVAQTDDVFAIPNKPRKMKRKEQKNGVLDGQHRLGAIRELVQQNLWPEAQNILVEVYPLPNSRTIAQLFTEINKAEPIKLVDMPGEVTEKVRTILNEATERLKSEFPGYFSSNPRCKRPRINIDVLRNRLHEMNVIDRYNIESGDDLYDWLMDKNEELSKIPFEEWDRIMRRERRTLDGQPEKILDKAREQNFFLGVERNMIM